MSEGAAWVVLGALFCLCVFATLGYLVHTDYQLRMVCVVQTGNPECKR